MVILQVNGDKKYQIHLKSESGPIYVLLVNQEQEHTPPLVVQVSWLEEMELDYMLTFLMLVSDLIKVNEALRLKS